MTTTVGSRTALPRILTAAIVFVVVASVASAEVPLPDQSDWVHQGIIFTPGPDGSWESRYSHVGFSPGAVVRKDGKLLMYYMAAAGTRSNDSGPAHRALGVAFCNIASVDCTDGANWQKYGGNPVLTYNPNPNHSNSEEEGIWSVAAAIDPANGDVVIYYGALYAVGSTSVDAEIRVATSTNGFDFENDKSVFNRDDNQPAGVTWECPECAPTGAISVNGTWYVYTATGADWDLGLFWGPARDSLPNSKQLLDDVNGERISDGAKLADLDGDDFLLMIGHNPTANRTYALHRMAKNDPLTLPSRESAYLSGAGVPAAEPWENYKHAAIFYDAPTLTWYYFYQPAEPDTRPYGLWTYQAGPPDDSAPSVPQNLGGSAASDSIVNLSWSASFDAESGVSGYNVYRNGQLVGQPAQNSFSNSGLSESTAYTYRVSAVNGAGLESAQSQAASITTRADTTRPTIVDAWTTNAPTQVYVEFSEPVQQASATAIANYSISNGVSVFVADLDADLRTVTLTTSAMTTAAYTLTVNSVRDRSAAANAIAANSTAQFNYDDSATIEVRISSAADDAEQSGSLHLDSSDLELVTDGSNVQTVGLRFTALDIPAGATIHQAWVQFTVDEEDAGPTALTIRGEASDNAAVFGEFAQRPRTGSQVAWSPPVWDNVNDAGPGQRTPNIAPVLQEIVSRPGWSAGNALAVIISGSGVRTAFSYDGDPGKAPMLHIEFSSSPPTEPPPPPVGLIVN